MLGMASFVSGVALFSWTLVRSQNISDQSLFGGWSLFNVLWVAFCVRGAYKALAEGRKARPKLELRQRRLRELLASLDASE